MTSSYPPSSSRNTQPAPAVHPPPPYVVTRLDAALPPMYDTSWKNVKENEFFPVAFRKDKGAFRAYAQANIVLQPGWFGDFELKRRSAKDVLWPKTELVSDSLPSDSLYWSLRLLRYQVRIDKKTLKVSRFAAMIVFETIFVVLTPSPGSWPGGLDTIANLTGWRSSDIEEWFAKRMRTEYQRQSQLGRDFQTEVTEQLVTTHNGDQPSVYVRKDARDLIPNIVWNNADAFNYCLINLLKRLADRRLPKCCTLTLHRSHCHGIYVGPLEHRFGTEWTHDPLRKLQEIQTHRLPQINRVEQLKFPSPVTDWTPRDIRFHIFLFNDKVAVDDYMKSWGEGRIWSSSQYRHVGVQAYDAEQHD